VLASAVVRDLPFRIDDRSFTHFDDAIAGDETRRLRRLDQIDMRPLVAMIVNRNKPTKS